jgi:predicted RNA binding protein YcfA (HicA-like mRNA interferase family)
MKRAELVMRLKALGWSFDRMSGANHELWRHASKRHHLIIRTSAILPAATAERLLEEAERG